MFILVKKEGCIFNFFFKFLCIFIHSFQTEAVSCYSKALSAKVQSAC